MTLDPAHLDPAGMLVALSGGPDSTALLLALSDAGIPLVAAHFDHALRPESATEAELVARRCRGWGIPLHTGRRLQPLAGGSVQAAARAARYAFLEATLRQTGLRTAALGHTADDLIEGALMHLLRGSGLAGMRGMPARRGPFVRPLLQVRRAEIERYLDQRGVTALQDPSNRDLRHLRVRIRLQLLPALERDLPGIGSRIFGAAQSAARLQAQVEDAAAVLSVADGALSIEALVHARAPVRVEALRQAYSEQAGAGPALSRRHHAAMSRLLEHGSPGQTLDLPGQVRIRRGYRYVEMVGMRKTAPPIETSLRLRACSGCDARQAAHFPVGTELALGRRRPGLRMRPLPAGRLCKLQDILVNAKVPRHERDSLSLVFADGELAWVPGIAIDGRWAAAAGQPSIHAEVVSSGDALLESITPTQGVLS